MSQRVRLTALLVANQLDLKGIKNFLDIKPLADLSSELFYRFSDTKYQHYFNFGVVVFTGHTEEEIKWALNSNQRTRGSRSPYSTS